MRKEVSIKEGKATVKLGSVSHFLFLSLWVLFMIFMLMILGPLENLFEYYFLVVISLLYINGAALLAASYRTRLATLSSSKRSSS